MLTPARRAPAYGHPGPPDLRNREIWIGKSSTAHEFEMSNEAV